MKKKKSELTKRGLTEINLTSLVDVSLTLVIIFMVSYPLIMQSAIKVSTPALQKAKAVMDETELKAEINLRANNIIELNGVAIDPVQFADSLQMLLAQSTDKIVVVSAEDAVLHDRVVEILDEAKQCGAEQLSLVRLKK